MAKRNRNTVAAATAADETTITTATVETVTETVTVETPSNDDDAILAALEAADSPFETVETVEVADEGLAERHSVADPDEQAVGGEADIEVQVEATEEVEVALDEADEDAVLAALEADDDNAAAPTKKKRAASTKTTAAPTVVRQFCDVADHMDDAELKATLAGIAAKKVHEKAQNLVQAIETGKKLSGFTKLAIKVLERDGRVTSKSLVEAYQADNKSLGTARAQSQQMTALFKALGIAQPDPANPRELVRVDNGLTKELAALAA